MRLYATSRIHGLVNVAGPRQCRRLEQEAIRNQPHPRASKRGGPRTIQEGSGRGLYKTRAEGGIAGGRQRVQAGGGEEEKEKEKEKEQTDKIREPLTEVREKLETL